MFASQSGAQNLVVAQAGYDENIELDKKGGVKDAKKPELSGSSSTCSGWRFHDGY